MLSVIAICTMDIDSNNNFFNGSDEVEEKDNSLSFNECEDDEVEEEEVEEPKKGMRLEVNDAAGIGLAKNFHSIVVEAGGYEALMFDERDARNYINNARRLRLGVGDAESVTHYFYKMQQQNSNFYSAINLDEDGCMHNLFWADARSRVAYKAFGDVVSFDTTYLTNKYDMPFAPFVGVNHHGQLILFGCGLLSNENTETFVWLFKEWLSCMSDAPPKTIITDQCRAMQNAIEIVFPQARHRWCLWHIMKKISEKLRGYSQYESIKVAFSNAVYDSFTIDEFEEYWEAMIENFNLNDNKWLGVEKETKADFKSRNKLYDCLTVYRFEKQFRAAYTNYKFKEVQLEMKRLVYCRANLIKNEGPICTYHVREAIVVGEGMKKVKFVVYFNSTKCELQCMCQLFEFRGIMCAHSFSVLIERSIYEVPTKYIVSRWRKDLERGYTCILTTYINFGSSLHPKLHDNYHNTLDEILDLVTNDDAKHKVIQLGLMKMKDEVRTVQSSSASNVPCTSTLLPSSSTLPPSHTSPKSPPRINTTKESMTRKVRSPLVACRRGRPCTKRKVSKVDAIVNWLKGKNKKVRQGEPRKLSFPCMGSVQHTMYEPVSPSQHYYRPSMDAIPNHFLVPAPVTISGDDIGSTSHQEAGMVNNISCQRSIVPSYFVDLNIDGDPNKWMCFAVVQLVQCSVDEQWHFAAVILPMLSAGILSSSTGLLLLLMD
ncbi:protein FAR1-RELATED SEQUENCE 6-like [Camellia sinensis]|uniref:protein FAR1-RELATED SEQUENCE 6-like n=1 Tax=Camellia sinensis TaxID=4442 RepID=UPI001036745F|nr:protein FAR1-RELATED SEQUENCE 6-like [Camellia sinensis]